MNEGKPTQESTKKAWSIAFVIRCAMWVGILILGVALTLLLIGVIGIVLWAIGSTLWVELQETTWTGWGITLMVMGFMALLVAGPYIVKWAWKKLKHSV